MNEKHKIIAFFIMIGVALLGCSNAVEEASYLDVTPPEIRATTPINDTIDYSVQGEISVEFNEAMDKPTLAISFKLDRIIQGQTEPEPVGGEVDYRSNTYIATYVPNGRLLQGESYVATVNTSAADTSGNRLLEQYQWEFATTDFPEVLSVYATDQPAADPTAFPFNSPLTIEFSEKINSGNAVHGRHFIHRAAISCGRRRSHRARWDRIG